MGDTTWYRSQRARTRAETSPAPAPGEFDAYATFRYYEQFPRTSLRRGSYVATPREVDIVDRATGNTIPTEGFVLGGTFIHPTLGNEDTWTLSTLGGRSLRQYIPRREDALSLAATVADAAGGDFGNAVGPGNYVLDTRAFENVQTTLRTYAY